MQKKTLVSTLKTPKKPNVAALAKNEGRSTRKSGGKCSLSDFSFTAELVANRAS